MAVTETLHASTTGQSNRTGGMVGPNAVLQLEAALRSRLGPTGADWVFAAAGQSNLLHEPPKEMIDERVPSALFGALWRELPADEAAEIAHEAGLRTADYILANRIPKPAQLLLKWLPARLAAPLLLKAIQKSAWTFAGSGTCRVRPGRISRIEIAANPLAMPGCVWHVGVFERLFRTLVSPSCRVRHFHKGTAGETVCGFDIMERGAGREAQQ